MEIVDGWIQVAFESGEIGSCGALAEIEISIPEPVWSLDEVKAMLAALGCCGDDVENAATSLQTGRWYSASMISCIKEACWRA